ncbi:MAG TPA: hypothetical protein VHV83_20710 [Armatimonadota bacterium]|nr:hypothetical protein [Armatimonadota bacterium]
MTYELFTQHIDSWVTQYIAVFCIITILIWGTCSYLLTEKWVKPVRDGAIYLAAIGALTLLLALRPAKTDIVLWAPLTWFSFSMLMVLELFWISYLTEGIIRAAQSIPARLSQGIPNEGSEYSGYHRR